MRLITAPVLYPLTLEEAKDHLRLESDSDDAHVTDCIAAAVEWVEAQCRRRFVTQTWELILDSFPYCEELELPGGVLASITSVKYLDESGVEQTWSSANYEVDAASEPGKLRLAYGASWPTHRDRWNAIVIRYVLGTAVEFVPVSIKNALKLLTSQMYEHRTPEVSGAVLAPVKFSVDALIGPYRLPVV